MLFGFGLFVGSVLLSTDNYKSFLDLPSFVMVVGGTLASTFVAYEPRYVLNALKVVRSIFFAPRMGPADSDKRGGARDPLGVHRPEKRPARTGS